jgi:hypothetical protein
MRGVRAYLTIFAVFFGLSGNLSYGQGEIALPEGTRIALQLNDHLSTKFNNEGDAFTAKVIVPVYQGDRIIIPKESIVSGSISRVVRPGRFRGKAVMNLLFKSIRVPGRPEISIIASLSRVDPEGNSGIHPEGGVEGESSVGRDATRVLTPGATGAGVGGLAGGAKGAAVGGGIGAAIGLATVFATRGKDLELRRGSTLDITLDRPLTVSSEP